MLDVQTLIDKCVLLCGGQSALARKLATSQQAIQAMQKGRRTISGQTVGQLCELLELDSSESQRLLAEATISAAPAEKQGVLRRAFFGSWVIGAMCGAAGMMTPGDARSTTASERQIAAQSSQIERLRELPASDAELTKHFLSNDVLYIVAIWRHLKRAWSTWRGQPSQVCAV